MGAFCRQYMGAFQKFGVPLKRPYRGYRSVGFRLRFPKIRGTFFGIPAIRIVVFWGLYWGPLILGNYQIDLYVRLERYLGGFKEDG